RMPRRTIRLRLTLIYGGLFLLSGAALLAITFALFANATGFFFAGPDGNSVSFFGEPPDAGAHEQTLTVSGLTPEQAEAQAARLEALAVRERQAGIQRLLVHSGIALALMSVVSVVLGWVMAGRVLGPLRTITSTVRSISAASLHNRLGLTGPDDELKELGDTFDGLLARLEASFEAQRRFVANASHELRTPLTRQRTLAQVALSDPDADADSLRRAHERVLASGEEQERLIEALLTLARGQAGLDRHEPFDLAEIAAEIAAGRKPDAVERGLSLEARLRPAWTSGDPRLVRQLVGNLVDNAIVHNDEGGWLEVYTGTRGEGAVLAVTNSGPQIPADQVDRLFEPFQRLGADRTGGSVPRSGHGLGLSIVQAIARAHDAAVRARPLPRGGMELELTFVPQRRVDECHPRLASGL
ncbi:MAG TPA: ATP-binding protein, partial [Actinopolymorphaceae bacterium]